MLYKDFKGDKLSQLGFGLMRLPVREDGSIDEELTEKMIDRAYHSGINYFDTAYPYHGGKSELVAGKILKKYPRDSFFFADKFPGHQICDDHTPAPVFEEQLKKCQVEYFDYYLLHNVTEGSLDVYLDPKWDIVNYLVEQKKRGRIRHLGFSSHGDLATLKTFLDKYAEYVEFCQLQINYVDWTLQKSREKYDLVSSYGLKVWIMEPVRGGRLAKLNEEQSDQLKKLNPEYSNADWCFRFVQEMDNAYMTLSGMTSMDQLESNLNIYKDRKPLTEEEHAALEKIAKELTSLGPQCTACRYCVEGCPKHIDIPRIMNLYNDLLFSPSISIDMKIAAMDGDRRPAACIKCGKCKNVCPQKLDIPFVMSDITERMSHMKSWAELCKERLEAAKNSRP